METARPYNLSIIVAGAWLLVSAFLWRHTTGQAIDAAAVGIGSILLGGLALRHTPNGRWARYLVVPLGLWLFVSAWLFPGGRALTVVNHLTVASWLLGVAMLPVEAKEYPPTPNTFLDFS